MTGSRMRDVALADALFDGASHHQIREMDEVVWAWFRANRDTLGLLYEGPVLSEFDALLTAATRLGVEERTPRP